jgi:L-malate glycosyltransferase
VAVFRFQKRLTEWLEVFGRVAANEPQLYGIMVGDGPLRDEVEKKIRLLKLEGRVLLQGLQEDMRPWLSAMDIFMMSSVFEGLPLALLEAMSMECAVVSTDAGGIKEVIRHEVDGFMVPAAEWLQLEGYLGQLCRAPLLRETMGNNARKKIIDQYSLQNMVSALEVVYRHHGNGVS